MIPGLPTEKSRLLAAFFMPADHTTAGPDTKKPPMGGQDTRKPHVGGFVRNAGDRLLQRASVTPSAIIRSRVAAS